MGNWFINENFMVPYNSLFAYLIIGSPVSTRLQVLVAEHVLPFQIKVGKAVSWANVKCHHLIPSLS